jgi:two-component system, NarL family, nitrate/nitrite response regulator NarL
MDPEAQVRIVVVDDHPIFRDGLKRLLEAEGFLVVGETGDGTEALRLVVQLQPDVLLLDLAMPGVSGLDVLKRLPVDSPVRTIVLTAGIDSREVVAALQLGARGVVLKESTTAMLYKAIRCVTLGQYWLPRGSVSTVVQAMRSLARQVGALERSSSPFGLTRREQDIVSGVAAGESNREIAARLKIREDTVKHHLSNIFDKVGVFSRLELAVFAINHRLSGDEVREA